MSAGYFHFWKEKEWQTEEEESQKEGQNTKWNKENKPQKNNFKSQLLAQEFTSNSIAIMAINQAVNYIIKEVI